MAVEWWPRCGAPETSVGGMETGSHSAPLAATLRELIRGLRGPRQRLVPDWVRGREVVNGITSHALIARTNRFVGLVCAARRRVRCFNSGHTGHTGLAGILASLAFLHVDARAARFLRCRPGRYPVSRASPVVL